MHKLSKFGTYRAPATIRGCRSAHWRPGSKAELFPYKSQSPYAT